MFAVRGATLWDMARLTVPDICVDFEAVRATLSSARAACFIERVYATMRTVNFSTEVLSPLASRLRVLAVPEVGWSDWGSVDRILASAKAIGRLQEIAMRLDNRKIKDPSTRTIVAHFLGTLNANRPEPAERDEIEGKVKFGTPSSHPELRTQA